MPNAGPYQRRASRKAVIECDRRTSVDYDDDSQMTYERRSKPMRIPLGDGQKGTIGLPSAQARGERPPRLPSVETIVRGS